MIQRFALVTFYYYIVYQYSSCLHRNFCMMNRLKYSRLVISISFLLMPLMLLGQRNVIEFERISIEQGLSQSTIFCIVQDHKGFMWFGTEDGLNRFDGYEFKVFNSDVEKEGTIASNRVIALLVDKNHNLWAGTIGGGLNKFDYKTETFTQYRSNPLDSTSLSNDRIMSLCEDPSGKIWVGTADGGLSLFDPEKETFKVFMNTPSNPNLLPDNVIRAILIDSYGDLWAGTNKGVCMYHPNAGNFLSIPITDRKGTPYNIHIIRKIFEDREKNIWIATDEEGLIRYVRKEKRFELYTRGGSRRSLAHNSVHDVYQDTGGTIWVATYGGLQRYAPETNDFETFTTDPTDQRSISSNLVRSIFEDKTGVMWVGTYNDGVNKFSGRNQKFITYRNQPNRPLGISSSTIRSFFEDNEGIVWIATYGHGLVRFDSKNETFKSYRNNPLDPKSLSNDNVTAIVNEGDSKLWVGTTMGLCLFDKKTETFKVYKEDPFNGKSLSNNNIRVLFVDRNNDLWLGSSGGGLMKYERETDSFSKYLPDILNAESTLSQDRVLVIYEDQQKNFWVGTSGEGLNLFTRATGVFKHFKNIPNDPTSISSNRILCIHQDSRGRLWVGTGGGGLNLFDTESQTFKAFRKTDGLPNDVIYGILEDSSNNLWLSTNFGLSCFNPDSATPYRFKNYTKSDGLQSNEFAEGAFMKSISGLMYFGGINGFNVFDPTKLTDNPYPPQVYITSITIDEKKTKNANNTRQVLNFIEKDLIVLPYGSNNITIYYTGIHFIAPEKISYKHLLEGFESSWITPLQNQRFATYTNLKPGKYVFRVIAANPDGLWNSEGDSLTVIIKPPYWKTWWFILIMLTLGSGIVIGIVFLREASLIKAKKDLEELVELRTAEITKKNLEMSIQAEKLRQANEEIIATSDVLAQQNKDLQEMNEEVTSQRNELEEQRNSLANLAWELQEKNEEITAQRNEIQKQKDLLAIQQKEITDSIMYAKRIQQAILPTMDQVRECFSEFFIFYRPKSIVSGDFYWTSRIGKYRIIAVVDCTGHGVPGGFMSMLGMMMLNEVISQKQILDPAQALNYLRQNIISVLHQKGEVADAGDGMDLSLCIIDDDDLTMHYAGANSSMIILQQNESGNASIIDLSSDRMPISYHLVMRSFTTQKIKLKKNSLLYLYSDGISDQFGGEQGRKFQLPRLREFITENSQLPLTSQGIVLEQLFDKWKGDMFQVDDVLVMGLKV